MRAVLARSRSVQHRSAGARGPASARHRPRRAGGPLPAQAAAGRGPRARSRGARALEPSSAWNDRPRRVRSARRAHRPDQSAHRVRVRNRSAPMRGVAREQAGRPLLGQPVDSQPLRPGSAGDDPVAAGPLHRAAGVTAARDHREPLPDGCRAREDGARRAQGDGRDARDRRLRHRLLVAVTAAAAPVRRDQDRPVVRDADGDRPRRRGARTVDHRARAQPRAARHRRGRRERQRAAHAARAWLRLRPGLPRRQAGTGRRVPSPAGAWLARGRGRTATGGGQRLGGGAAGRARWPKPYDVNRRRQLRGGRGG